MTSCQVDDGDSVPDRDKDYSLLNQVQADCQPE